MRGAAALNVATCKGKRSQGAQERKECVPVGTDEGIVKLDYHYRTH